MRKMLTLPPGRRKPQTMGLRSRMLQAVFGVLYGSGARIYDRFTRFAFAGEWQRWQMTAMGELPPGGIIVELGCGTGEFAAVVASRFRIWIAIDISHEMISIAKRRHHPPTPAFVRARADAVPLRAGFADAIVATFPSRNIFEPKVVKEIARLLRPSGQLVVVLTAELSAVGFRRRCVRAVSAIVLGGSGNGEPWAPEIKGFDGKSEWQQTEYGRALVYAGRRL